MSVDLTKYCSKVRQMDLLGRRGAVTRVAGLTVESKGPPEGKGERLSEEQIGILEQWVRDGAVWSPVSYEPPK